MISPDPPALRCTFGGLGIRFDRRVLRPRPWTIAQSEWAVELAGTLPAGPVLELCCGVGHIGQVVAARTGRRLVQVDADAVACDFARANSSANGTDATVEVRQRSLADGPPPPGRFALVLADPPYLPSADCDRYPEDPRHAVDGGGEGTALLAACLDVAVGSLLRGGQLLLQARGPAQLAQVAAVAPLVLDEVRAVDRHRAVGRFVEPAE